MSEELPEKEGRRAIVLLVEDDEVVRRSLQLLLRSRGFDVMAYASARQLLTDPGARAAQCLVADLVMPDHDGVALLQALRGEGWSRPAILISGFLDQDSKERARKAGFDEIFAKPIVEGQLLAAVAKYSDDAFSASGPARP